MEWLKDRFPEKLISLESKFIGPHVHQILTTNIIYLWGYMKDEIWRKKIHATIIQMKKQVKEIIVR